MQRTRANGLAGAAVQAVAVAAALCHPAGTPLDAVEFVAAVRLAVADSVLTAKLDVAAVLARRGAAREIAARIGTGLLAAESVPAPICAFLSHPESFPDAVTLAISFGGDAGTLASMTGAISGALLGETAIPARWLERTTIATRVRDLADGLHAAAVQASPWCPGSDMQPGR